MCFSYFELTDLIPTSGFKAKGLYTWYSYGWFITMMRIHVAFARSTIQSTTISMLIHPVQIMSQFFFIMLSGQSLCCSMRQSEVYEFALFWFTAECLAAPETKLCLQRQNFAVSQTVICTYFQIRTNVCTGVIKTDGFILIFFPPYKGEGSADFKRWGLPPSLVHSLRFRVTTLFLKTSIMNIKKGWKHPQQSKLFQFYLFWSYSVSTKIYTQ